MENSLHTIRCFSFGSRQAMHVRRVFQWSGFTAVAARILLCLLLLNQELRMVRELDAAGDPAEQNAVNCISISSYMTPKAISNVKTAKCCNALLWGISLTTDEVTGCIGDNILVDEDQSKELVQSACSPNQPQPRRSRRSLALNFDVTSNTNKKWSLPINYLFNLSYTNASLTENITRNVMNYMQNETCVTFVQQNTQNTIGSLTFTAGAGCLAYMGRSENNQTTIVLQSQCYFSFGEILSLLTSTLGLADDSLRPDSSNYIFINESNLDSSNYPMPLLPPAYITYNLPYDYASVLHVYPTKSTSQFNQITFRTVEPWFQNTIGQRSQLSFIDTKLINLLYCSEKCNGVTNSCDKGGYPDPNNCSKCKCPDGWDPNNRCTTIIQHNTDQCGQQSYDLSVTLNGTIQSPGYITPQYYDPSLQLSCIWNITAPVGSHVTITFQNSFGVYCKNQACYDWVEVRYNGSLNDTGPRFCCNKPLAQTIKSKDNQMMILFRSFGYADVPYRGFQIKFEVDPCMVIWSPPNLNHHSFGGVEAPGPLSLDDCLMACDVSPTCFGVDVDSSMIASTGYPKCFLHTSQSLAGGSSPASSVNQYIVTNKCSTITTTTTTITTTTPTTFSSTVSVSAQQSMTTLSTTTPSGLGSCFSSIPGRQSSGARQVQSGQSLTDCLRACLSEVCAGVDFVQMTTTECWLYDDPQKLKDKYDNPAITQYINNCNVSFPTTTLSTTTSTTTTTTTTALPTTTSITTTTTGLGSCFSSLPGQQSSGAQKVQSGQSLTDCLSACLSQVCAGVEFVQMTTSQTTTECWLYDDPQKLKDKYANPAITQYINNCNVTIAITTPSTTTSTTTTTTTTTLPTTSSTSTTTTGLGSCFSSLPGQQSSGAQKIQSGQSLTDCLRACLSQICAGVEFVERTASLSETECWLYDDPQKLKDKYANSAITQYINICNVTIPLATSTTTLATTTSTTTTTTRTLPTSTSTTTTTTAPRSTFSVGPGVCPTTWTSRPGFQSSGATRNPALSTESDCVNYCLQTLSCIAVDVVMTTVPQECWVYSDISLLSNIYNNPGVTQYQFTRNCAISTTTPAGGGACQNQWVIYNSSHSIGATKTSNPMLLDDCLNRCLTDPLCVAIDFNSASNPVECWVHTSLANINVRYSNPNLTQYVISSRCPTSPAPPNPGCGGANANPGEFYSPCFTPVNPPKTCQKQIITFVFQGGCWTQRVDYVNTPCFVMTCYGNSQLVTMCGIPQCVVTGWSGWSSCSASCGSFGTQRRYRYAIVNDQYITVEQDERVCNTQVCPCSAGSCSRCCSGYYESNGFCYRWA